ncbi:uncharacterized protein Gm46725 [Mus musculus]|uniref:uncharacterized protein Gm46725 n=1 Tax=Mus musculus TaxID=10090 RepID=UPI00004287FD|nr:uncharacterized protein Gm46725 [Mus musculus]|eukprot:XP_017174851.1 PREDICTED: uncharacterized protein LOC108168727 [Mus musculus]
MPCAQENARNSKKVWVLPTAQCVLAAAPFVCHGGRAKPETLAFEPSLGYWRVRARVWKRAVTAGHPQIQKLNPEDFPAAVAGAGESPSCGCYWQPSLRRAQPAASGGRWRGKRLRRGGRSVPAPHRTVAHASSQRPSAPVAAAVLGEEPEASALSSGAASQASKNPGALRESNMAAGTAAPRHRERQRIAPVPGVRALSRVLPPARSPPCSEWLRSRPLFSSRWPTLAPGSRPCDASMGGGGWWEGDRPLDAKSCVPRGPPLAVWLLSPQFRFPVPPLTSRRCEVGDWGGDHGREPRHAPQQQ